MNGIVIDCQGEKLHLLPEKALFWPAEKILVVADLHLGKSAAFRAAGIAAPESTTADLKRLAHVVKYTNPRSLLLLGDLLHAPQGMRPVMLDALLKWRHRHPKLEIISVQGNHDIRCPPLDASFNIIDSGLNHLRGPFCFAHHPVEDPTRYVIAGHIHPAIVLRERFVAGLRAPCFWFARDYAVLPAFGSFTGMSNVRGKKGDRIFAVGPNEVIPVPARA